MKHYLVASLGVHEAVTALPRFAELAHGHRRETRNADPADDCSDEGLRPENLRTEDLHIRELGSEEPRGAGHRRRFCESGRGVRRLDRPLNVRGSACDDNWEVFQRYLELSAGQDTCDLSGVHLVVNIPRRNEIAFVERASLLRRALLADGAIVEDLVSALFASQPFVLSRS